MTTQSTSLRLADHLSENPFTWPGGYPLFGTFSDGGTCCHRCARAERTSIATTTGKDGWCLIALSVNWENPDLHCDICGSAIESAYCTVERNEGKRG